MGRASGGGHGRHVRFIRSSSGSVPRQKDVPCRDEITEEAPGPSDPHLIPANFFILFGNKHPVQTTQMKSNICRYKRCTRNGRLRGFLQLGDDPVKRDGGRVP